MLYQVLDSLVRLLTPILAFTSEEIYRYMPKPAASPISVQLLDMPTVNEDYIDTDLEIKWDRLMQVRSEVLKQLENARKDKFIGNSLEAAVHIYATGELYDFLKPMAGELSTLFITSQAYLHQSLPADVTESTVIPGLAIKVEKAAGEKCDRCWMYNEGVGENEQHPTLCPRCVAAMNVE